MVATSERRRAKCAIAANSRAASRMQNFSTSQQHARSVSCEPRTVQRTSFSAFKFTKGKKTNLPLSLFHSHQNNNNNGSISNKRRLLSSRINESQITLHTHLTCLQLWPYSTIEGSYYLTLTTRLSLAMIREFARLLCLMRM